MVGGLSIVLTGKTVVDETQLRKLAKACKSIFGMGAIQIYPYPMCQPVPTGLYTRYEFGAELKRLKSRHNKPRIFEKMVRSYFQRMRQDWGIESFYPTGTQREIDCFSADGFCVQCNPVFETMGSSYHYCSCHEAPSALTEEDIQRGTEKGNAEAVYRGEFTLFSKCGNLIGGNSTRLMSQKRNTWENFSHTTVHCVRNRYWKRGNQAHCLFTYIVISRFQNIKEINLQPPAILEKDYRVWTRCYTVNEEACWKERVIDSTATNVNLLLWNNQWHNRFCIATILVGAGTRLHQSLSLRWVHSCQMFQRLCAIRCQCLSSRWRKSQLQCCSID